MAVIRIPNDSNHCTYMVYGERAPSKRKLLASSGETSMFKTTSNHSNLREFPEYLVFAVYQLDKSVFHLDELHIVLQVMNEIL